VRSARSAQFIEGGKASKLDSEKTKSIFDENE
jgi:hypothetical protein